MGASQARLGESNERLSEWMCVEQKGFGLVVWLLFSSFFSKAGHCLVRHFDVVFSPCELSGAQVEEGRPMAKALWWLS